jgi:hypothetical protein
VDLPRIATVIAGGLFVPRYIVRKVGIDQFSMWTLALSLVEYYWLIEIVFARHPSSNQSNITPSANRMSWSACVNTGMWVFAVGLTPSLALWVQ